jgi:hypothetical protein
MRSVSNLMGLGCSPQLATSLGRDVQDSIAAAGAAQGTATALTGGICRITTATGGSADGVRLPSAGTFPGDAVVVINKSAATINVYPATGEKINTGTANAAVTVATVTVKTFYNINATDWAAY